jgi:uncharacterized membrane-anchored protein YitT (DUF2179 family)
VNDAVAVVLVDDAVVLVAIAFVVFLLHNRLLGSFVVGMMMLVPNVRL